jgi:hypothetical protein
MAPSVRCTGVRASQGEEEAEFANPHLEAVNEDGRVANFTINHAAYDPSCSTSCKKG